MRTTNRIVGTVLLGLSIFLYRLLSVPIGGMLGNPEYIGPFGFPKLLVICLGISSVMLLVGTCFSRETKPVKVSLNINSMKQGALLLATAGVYIWMLRIMGFVLPTLAFLLTLNLLLRQERKRNALVSAGAFALVTTAIAYVGFKLILNIYLPTGLLPF